MNISLDEIERIVIEYFNFKFRGGAAKIAPTMFLQVVAFSITV